MRVSGTGGPSYPVMEVENDMAKSLASQQARALEAGKDRKGGEQQWDDNYPEPVHC